MTQVCQICSHSKRLKIDRSIVQGGNLTKLAKEFNVPYHSLYAHAQEHVNRQLAQAWAKKELMGSLDILSEIESLIKRTKQILDRAESEGKLNTALNAIGQARGSYELLSKITFSLHQVRLTELELEKERSGEAERERRGAYDGHLAILTDAELDLFEQLAVKVQTQNKNLVIAPDPPKTVWP